MASFLRSVRQGFNRQGDGNIDTTNNAPRQNGVQNNSPTTYSPTMSNMSSSMTFPQSSGPSNENQLNSPDTHAVQEQPKFFFNDKYAKLGVKGNFMPLAAQPVNVDLADWLAHQTVENYRLVSTIALCIQEVDQNSKKSICNMDTCPKMTAGRHTYTWLDNNKQPVPVSAPQYISLVQRWMNGKVHDPRAFPTEMPNNSAATYASGSLNTPSTEKPIAAGPTSLTASMSKLTGKDWFGKESGFPESFFSDCRTCFRQIFRIYAHIYHSHWIDPFWNLSSGANSQGWTDLNSCFVHFCTVAKLYGLLSEKDAEPMQPLIDIWIGNGSIPQDAAREAHKIVPS